jgi:hypothetical protein
MKMKPIILEEKIDINQSEILEVDPIILMEMRDRLNPPSPFSYQNGDHLKQGLEDEKRMRKYTPHFLSWCKSYDEEVSEFRSLILSSPSDERQLRREYQLLTGKQFKRGKND